MVKCLECGKEFVTLNSAHMNKHGMTIAQYYEKYPEELELFNTEKKKGAGVKAVKEKIAKPKTKVSSQVARTIDDLYSLEDTIIVPDRFLKLDYTNLPDFFNMIDKIMKVREFDLDTETTGLSPFEDVITDISITIHDGTYEHNYHIPFLHIKKEWQNLLHEEVMNRFLAIREWEEGAKFGGRFPIMNESPEAIELLVPDQFSKVYVFNMLREILESPDIKKNMFNDYFDDLMIWGDLGINLQGVHWDGLIAGKVLNENEPSHKLKDLYGKYLADKEKDPQIKALGVETYEEQFGKIRFYRVPMKIATAYAAKDTYMTGKIKDFQKQYIESVKGLRDVFYDIEMPLLPVLIEMRKVGMYADKEFAHGLRDIMVKEREATGTKLFEILGDINLNSPKQLSKALFTDMRLPRIKGDSTAAAVLQELADDGHEVAELLLDYKKSEKLIGTYLENVDTIVQKRTGRVHCRFNQNGTVTGRLSSSDPNLQNIPAKNKYIRRMFRTQYPGLVLISCDYSQVEPRILSHIAKDPNMINSYKNGIDIYSSMASHVFSGVARGFAKKLTAEEATEEDLVHYASPLYKYLLENEFVYKGNMIPGTISTGYKPYFEWLAKPINITDCYDGSLFRKMMKTLLLGMMYSMSEKGLASRLKISDADAMEIMNYFFQAFPNIKTAMNDFKMFCKQNGFVQTMFGRKRRLPDIYSDEWFLRKKAERQVLNSVIQGTAADVMKLAMIKIGQDQRIRDLGGIMVATIHDEVLVEAPKEVAIQITKYIIEDMTTVCELAVPLRVDGEIFLDGQWYGESVALKNKGGEWKIYQDIDEVVEGQKTHTTVEIQESDIQWLV